MKVNWLYVLIVYWVVALGLGFFLFFKSKKEDKDGVLRPKKGVSDTLIVTLSTIYFVLLYTSAIIPLGSKKYLPLSMGLLIVATALYIYFSYRVYGKWTWHTTAMVVFNSAILALYSQKKVMKYSDSQVWTNPLYLLSGVVAIPMN